MAQAFADAPRANSPDRIVPEMHGLAVMELQRLDLVDFFGTGPKSWVGGFATLTTVTAESVTQKVIRRWPDQVGELITPAPIDWSQWWADQKRDRAATPRFPGDLSPLQRRRMEKKARKGTL